MFFTLPTTLRLNNAVLKSPKCFVASSKPSAMPLATSSTVFALSRDNRFSDIATPVCFNLLAFASIESIAISISACALPAEFVIDCILFSAAEKLSMIEATICP